MTDAPAPGELNWQLSLENPDLAATARWLVERLWQQRPPLKLNLDHQPLEVSPDWLERLGPGPEKPLAIYWNTSGAPSLLWYPGRVLAARFPFPADRARALAWLEPAPFQVAAFGTIHPEWADLDPDYSPPSFGANHFRLGWGCAFKGDGHLRLVSRRWLEYGPWQLWRGESDLSMAQFHSLTADAATALTQAKPAHARMGITDTGGFLQRNYVFERAPTGLYSPHERMLRIVVTGKRKLEEVELLDASAVRRAGTLGPGKPLERIAYIFTDPTNAQTHLHALWLRELECWSIVDGVERRLDMDYHPPRPAPPAWSSP